MIELVALALSRSRSKTACEMHRVISTLISSKELSSVKVPTNLGNLNNSKIEDSEVSENSSIYHTGLQELASSWRKDKNSLTKSSKQINHLEEDDDDEDSSTHTTSDDDENEHSEYYEQDIASESSFNAATSSSSDDEEIYIRAAIFSRTSSFSSIRWSDCLKSIVSSKTDIERANILSLFLAQHDKITDILLDKTQSLGQFRLGILQIIQVTVFSCDDNITPQFINSKLLVCFVKVFFSFHSNNIMHHIVQDTVSGILKRNDDTLVYHLLVESLLIQHIIDAIHDKQFKSYPNYGFILLMNLLKKVLLP